MPIILDHQLREQITHDAAIFPITYFCNELASLPNWAGPLHCKDGMMSLLHSFYCWGAVGVILGSTLFFSVFGVANWKILTLIWAIAPLYTAGRIGDFHPLVHAPTRRTKPQGAFLTEGAPSIALGFLFSPAF